MVDAERLSTNSPDLKESCEVDEEAEDNNKKHIFEDPQVDILRFCIFFI